MNKEDSVISIKFYSMQKQIDKLQQENKQLKSIIKTLIKEYNLEPTEYVKNLLKDDSNDK